MVSLLFLESEHRKLYQVVNLNCHFVSQLKPYHFVLMRKRWIPESPRWLVAHNRLDEAHGLLMKYATKNGVSVDPKQLRHMISEVRKADVRKNDTRKYGTCDLVRTPKLRKRIIICCFNW